MSVSTAIVLATLFGHAGIRFDDVTASSGLPMFRTPTLDYGFPASAWLDWDRDGLPDLVMGDAVGPTRYFRNRGDFTFEEQSGASLLALEGVVSMEHVTVPPGIWPDGGTGPTTEFGPGLIVSRYVEGRSVLAVLRMGAPGEVTVLPVRHPAQGLVLTTHGDLDLDGRHELVAADHACGGGLGGARMVFKLHPMPSGYRVRPDEPQGTGCYPVPVVTDDLGHGQPAVLVATDFGPVDDPGYVMRRDGRRDALPESYGMGVAIGDTNGDLLPDYLLTNIGRDVTWQSLPGQALPGESRPDGGAGARRVGIASADTEWGEEAVRYKWGATYLDADSDGDLELWASAAGLGEDEPIPAEVNARDVLVSDGRDVATEAGVALEGPSRVVTLADIDRDGRLDALVGGDIEWVLFRNISSSGGFVGFEAPDEPGMHVTVEACGRTFFRELSGGNAGAASEALVHVGIGDCAGPVNATIRFPGGAVRRLSDLEVGRYHPLAPQGRITFEPAVAAPGQEVTVRSTFGPTSTLLLDGSPVSEGASWTAPTTVGRHDWALTVDGGPSGLRPTLEVAEGGVDVATEPWPPRVGAMAAIVTAPETAVLVTSGGDGDASGVNVTGPLILDVGGDEVRLASVAGLAARPPFILTSASDGVVVSVALVDGAGSARPELGKLGVQGWDADGGYLGDARLLPVEAPWLDATLPFGTARVLVTLAGEAITMSSESGPPTGQLDATRSRVWVAQPLLRADGQDLIEVLVSLVDTHGHAMVPDTLALPTSNAAPRVDDVWTPRFRRFGAFWYSARLRAPLTPGAIDIAVGELTAWAYAFPAEPRAIDAVRTELGPAQEDGATLRLLPRDVHGQRIGPGVTTDPAFDYVGNGEYRRPAEGVDTVVVGGVSYVREGERFVLGAPPAGDCGMVALGRGEQAPPWPLVPLVMVVLWGLRSSRGLGPGRAGMRREANRPTHG